jgi:hypothetical protein
VSDQNPRDTQFANFAKQVIADLEEVHALQRRKMGCQQILIDDVIAIIARRGYDLVEHAIETMNPIAHQYAKSTEEIIKDIPDMPELPEDQVL